MACAWAFILASVGEFRRNDQLLQPIRGVRAAPLDCAWAFVCAPSAKKSARTVATRTARSRGGLRRAGADVRIGAPGGCGGTNNRRGKSNRKANNPSKMRNLLLE